MIFLHGFLGSRLDWGEMADKAVELKGTLEEFVVPKDVTLVGYSMGGRIALQLAEMYPKRVRRLVLIGAHLGLEDAEREDRRRWEEKWLQVFETVEYEKALRMWYAQAFLPELTPELLERRVNDPSPWEYMRTYSLAKQKNYRGAMPNVETHFVVGEHDEKYRKLYEEKAYVVEGAGHAVHMDQPQRLLKFLKLLI